MNACLFALSAGVIILYCSAILLPLWFFIAAFCVFFLCASRRLLLPLLLVVFGWAYANQIAIDHLANQIPAHFEGRLVTATGFRCSLIAPKKYVQTFRFCVSELENINGELLLGDRTLSISAPLALDIPLSTKQLVLTVRLKAPRGSVNPVGLPAEQYFFQQRISAVGSVAEIVGESADDPGVGSDIRQLVTQWRSVLQVKLKSVAGHVESYGVIQALVLGDRSAILDKTQRVLSATGTQHLMAISGLHVGMIAFLLLRFLPVSAGGVLIFSTLTLLYVALVGFSASAQRAWVMMVVLAVVRGGACQLSWSTAWLAALAIVLLLDPLATLSLGFWFSFASVGLLILLTQSGWLSLAHPIRSFLLAQCFFLALLGLLNAMFGLEHNAVSSLANLIAIPWVSWFVLPVALLSFVVGLVDIEVGRSLFFVLDEVLVFLFEYLSSLSLLPMALTLDASIWRIAAYGITLLCIVLFGRPAFFIMVCMLLVSCSLLMRIEGRHAEPELLVLDAGQGLSIVIRSGPETWLYDLGNAWEGSSLVDRSLLPYLRSVSAEKSLDGVVVSHGDSDHAGDYLRLFEHTTAGMRLSGQPERLTGLPHAHAFSHCYAGMISFQPGLTIEVLYPTETSQRESANNHSCVVMITMSGKRFLLMGDLEGHAEKAFVAQRGADLRADVLIAGHHGSANASSYALLKHVRPSVVVFSSGYRNRFGHPHASVLARVEAIGARSLNTAESGALRFSVESGVLHARAYRAYRKAFWLAPPP